MRHGGKVSFVPSIGRPIIVLWTTTSSSLTRTRYTVTHLPLHPTHRSLYTVKKVHEFPVSSRDVTNQTPPGQEWLSYDVIIPAQGEFGSDIPAGDWKPFFTV
jgi:hypothetical protein